MGYPRDFHVNYPRLNGFLSCRNGKRDNCVTSFETGLDRLREQEVVCGERRTNLTSARCTGMHEL